MQSGKTLHCVQQWDGPDDKIPRKLALAARRTHILTPAHIDSVVAGFWSVRCSRSDGVGVVLAGLLSVHDVRVRQRQRAARL